MSKQLQDYCLDRDQYRSGVPVTTQVKASMDRCRARQVLNAFAKTTVRCMFSLSCISMETLTGEILAYSQCREEVDNSWAADPSWECQQPGDQATGTLPSTDSTSSQPVVAAAASSPVVAAAASSPVAAASSSGPPPATTPDQDSSQDSSSDSAGTQSATQGSCDSTVAPSGWDGVASTSVSFASTMSNAFS